VSECDLEASEMRTPWLTRGRQAIKNVVVVVVVVVVIVVLIFFKLTTYVQALYTLNTQLITIELCTVVMSVNADFPNNVSYTVSKYLYRLLRTKCHASSSNDFLIINIKSKVKEDFRTHVMKFKVA
jgi:ubiquitin C-terminal hydrolase